MTNNRNENMLNGLFFQNVVNHDLLSHKKQNELIIALQKGDQEAYCKFISSNLRLAIMCASECYRKYGKSSSLDYTDACQEGFIGLIKAAAKFKPELGYKFSTYAVYWIRQTVKQALLKHRSLLSVPGNAGEDAMRMSKNIGLAKQGDIKWTKRLHDLERINGYPVSILRGDEENADGILEELVLSDNDNLPDAVTMDKVLGETVRGIVSYGLSKELSGTALKTGYDVICRRYGFPPYVTPQSLKEIGMAYGKSTEWARLSLLSSNKILRKYDNLADFLQYFD